MILLFPVVLSSPLLEDIVNISISPGGTKDRPREISVLGLLNVRIYIFRKK